MTDPPPRPATRDVPPDEPGRFLELDYATAEHTIHARIRGLSDAATVREWLLYETETRTGDPRKAVVGHLNRRLAALRDEGGAETDFSHD